MKYMSYTEIIEAQPAEPGEESQEEDEQFSGDSEDSGASNPTDTSRDNDPSAPYMRYHLAEVYNDKADVVQGSHTYRQDPDVRRKAGFHTQGRGQAYKNVTFSTARCNKRPDIPGPWDYVEKAENGDINVKVVGYQLESISATPSATGDQVLYTADGHFTALMDRAYSRNESWRINNAPTVGNFDGSFPFDKTQINNIDPGTILEYSNQVFNKFTISEEPQSEGDGQDGGSAPDPGI